MWTLAAQPNNSRASQRTKTTPRGLKRHRVTMRAKFLSLDRQPQQFLLASSGLVKCSSWLAESGTSTGSIGARIERIRRPFEWCAPHSNSRPAQDVAGSGGVSACFEYAVQNDAIAGCIFSIGNCACVMAVSVGVPGVAGLTESRTR